MRVLQVLVPGLVLTAAFVLVRATEVGAWQLAGYRLPLTQRDFRVFNNFTGTNANDNQTPDPNFPGAQGAVMAIWKAHVEWGSALHGNGNGDPHQPGGLGSGGANFDSSFQGEADWVGTGYENIHSQISGCAGGVLAFTFTHGDDGWTIRYYECWNWDDGPGANISGWDLQGVAAHEVGHAIGMAHSDVGAATMYPFINGGSVAERSLHEDDIRGIKAAYGLAASTKPVITGVTVQADQVVIDGSNFDLNGAEVWFTNSALGDGDPLTMPASSSTGTQIVAPIAGNSGPGDVLVHNAGSGSDWEDLSNAWPADLMGVPCGAANYCVTTPNSVGVGMVIDYTGTISVLAEDLTLTVRQGPFSQPCLFYYGPEQIQIPFGEGVRCVGAGAIGTFRLPPTATDGFGDAQVTLDWTAPPVGSGPGAIDPGELWNFQCWYRDPNGGPSGFNLSDALEITFCP